MDEHKSIIDNNGNLIASCVLFKDGIPQEYLLEDGQQAVVYLDKKYLTPIWNGTEWIESATEEEINKWKTDNNIVQKPTQEEITTKGVANLKIDNMKKGTIITSTLKTIADLKVEIMGLKGGK